MFTEIRLKNFKCFREETAFPLAKINLLTGINGRGKSTLLQSLLLMKQSVEHNEYTNELVLNGNCVNLGNFEDIKNKYSAKTKQTFIFKTTHYTLDYEFDKKILKYIRLHGLPKQQTVVAKIGKVDSKLNVNEGKIEKLFINYHKEGTTLIDEKPYSSIFQKFFLSDETVSTLLDTNLFEDDIIHYIMDIRFLWSKIHYVAANRLGSQLVYKKFNSINSQSIDSQGENIASVLEQNKTVVPETLFCSSPIVNLKIQTSEWLSKILDTQVTINTKSSDYSDDVYLFFKINGKEYKPTNVGFGYSYVLPIIVSGLIAKKGEILIIENPEAHLHPKAQSELTKFLAKVASGGVQVFIESHSEHILRALQICTLQENIALKNTDVNILYFQNKENEPAFVQIPILENGSIETWYEDFFDQADKDYKILFGF